MSTPPRWASPRRVALLRRLRRERTRDEALLLDAEQRYARACALLDLAMQIRPRPAATARGRDEPPELWLALQRRLRSIGHEG
ncbi:MAG: hypothetical protein FJ125_17795 [Deltaproteobacteria bacterium]|nr:hypothetical protein [Deltaproteobacteria bacterium]